MAMRGTMLWFNLVKDHGVITTDNGDRLVVHGAGFADGERPTGRCAGAVVTFAVMEQDDEPTAANVSFVEEIAPRRARMRHARYRSH